MNHTKICRPCFFRRYPDRQPATVTWGAACDDCGTPTPSRATLVKVEATPEEAA